MELLPPEAAAVLPPLRSCERTADPCAVLRFFTPDGAWTWYVLEGEKQQDGDWLMFGLVDGFERELGYFALSELMGAHGPWGLPIERDLYWEPTPLSTLQAGREA